MKNTTHIVYWSYWDFTQEKNIRFKYQIVLSWETGKAKLVRAFNMVWYRNSKTKLDALSFNSIEPTSQVFLELKQKYESKNLEQIPLIETFSH